MKKMYHYTECGLDNIYLSNGFTVDKEGILSIQDIHGLHRAIGHNLVYKVRRLKGKEIRFIRHYMDLSQKGFGELLRVDYQTVLRWEANRNVIPQTAERLLKILFAQFLDPDSKAKELIDMISNLDNGRDDNRIEFFRRKEWKEAA
jgi:putative transcriptional regulator